MAAAAARSIKLIIIMLFLFINVRSFPLSSSLSSSSSCSDFKFSDGRVFESCADLPALNSFLHWTYDSTSRTLQIAYRHSHVTSSTWVAWGINPTSTKSMVGTQAIVAYQKPDDGTMAVFTSPVDSYQTQLQKGNLRFPVSNLSAAFFNNSEIIIFATMDMVMEIPNNGSTLTHVWQDGPVLSGNTLGMHRLSGDNLLSMGTLNLSSGQALPSHGPATSRNILKIIHGALNVISWGLMMPLGFMSARYLKAVGPATDPLWFYLHIAFQLPGYIIGMAGGATGLLLLLGKSSGIHHPCHLGIGITLFSLGLLQVSALVFRPGKDHKYRYIWNLFHHFTGYTVLILGFVNVWSGFKILKPSKGWLIAYGIVFGVLMLSTVLLEIWKRLTRDGKKKEEAPKCLSEGNCDA